MKIRNILAITAVCSLLFGTAAVADTFTSNTFRVTPAGENTQTADEQVQPEAEAGFETGEEAVAAVELSDASSTVNVRSGPGTGYEVVAALASGDEVTALGAEDGWTKIRLANGTEGYIRSDFLSVTPEAEAEQQAAAPERDVYLTDDVGAGETVTAGRQITITAHLVGYEGTDPVIYWQCDDGSGSGFTDTGVTGDTYTFEINDTNYMYNYRVRVETGE